MAIVNGSNDFVQLFGLLCSFCFWLVLVFLMGDDFFLTKMIVLAFCVMMGLGDITIRDST